MLKYIIEDAQGIIDICNSILVNQYPTYQADIDNINDNATTIIANANSLTTVEEEERG